MIQKLFPLIIIFLLGLTGCSPSSSQLLIDSFEGELTSRTVDFGAGGGASLIVEAEKLLKVCGEQSMKLEYDLKPSGYMWVARGYNLDVKDAARWLVSPESIDWRRYSAFRFSMYGRNSSGVIAFDIRDSGGEMWRFLVDDDFKGWDEIDCPFSQFFVRGDWQPQSAERNEVLDFPIMSFQFEPRFPGKGIYYFDCVKLVRIK